MPPTCGLCVADGDFFRQHRGVKVASTLLMAPMSQAFVTAIAHFAETEGIDVVHFRKHQSKDKETQRRLKAVPLLREGVLYIGVAQEKFSIFRVSKRHNPLTGDTFPWLSHADVTPTRGTHQRAPDRSASNRFIPAYTGNTRDQGAAYSRSRVHPRLRGEHGWAFETGDTAHGSSPPTRGTHPMTRQNVHHRRFIPAYAGNTLH